MSHVQLFVQSEGSREIRAIEVLAQATVRELLDAARLHGLHAGQHEEVAVFLEDGDHALLLDMTLDAVGVRHHGSVHVSRHHRIEVTVHFNGQHHARPFGPGATVRRIKEWATGPHSFGMTPVDAAEHVLQVAHTHERPDSDVHVGTLVHAPVHTPGCGVAFDLVAQVRVEG